MKVADRSQNEKIIYRESERPLALFWVVVVPVIEYKVLCNSGFCVLAAPFGLLTSVGFGGLIYRHVEGRAHQWSIRSIGSFSILS